MTAPDDLNLPDGVTASDLKEGTQEFLEVIDRIIREIGDQPDVTAKTANEGRVRVIAAFANEALNAAESTALLIRNELTLDACTSARRAFEHALYAAWICSDRGSVEAFIQEKGARWSLKMAKTLRKADVEIDLDEEMLAEVEQTVPSRKSRSEAADEVDSVEKVCDAFNPRLYVAYRWLCTTAHPSAHTVARHYLISEGKGDTVGLQGGDEYLAAHTAAASAVWAGRALDRFDLGQRRKQALKREARKLNISPVLHLGMPHEGRWPI